ncbi:MAG: hypothetical protein IT481_00070 [Gammaproteobacteria bacterium]|nr:hypothetical protein [Gammaproteobacteria bacterium]
MILAPRHGAAGSIAPLPGGSLHFDDHDLFFRTIRTNAVARSEACLSAEAEASRK